MWNEDKFDVYISKGKTVKSGFIAGELGTLIDFSMLDCDYMEFASLYFYVMDVIIHLIKMCAVKRDFNKI